MSCLRLFHFLLLFVFLAEPKAGSTFTAAEALDDSPEDDVCEGDEEAGNQPDVDHLGVRGRWKLLDLGGEDRCHHQHDRQVHCE